MQNTALPLLVSLGYIPSRLNGRKKVIENSRWLSQIYIFDKSRYLVNKNIHPLRIHRMLMPPKTGTAAVAIIRKVLPKESFLILRRTSHPDDPWSGHFSFPGGRRDKDDKNLLETCIRETREETGIILAKGQLQNSLPLEPAGRNFSNPLWVQPFVFNLLQLTVPLVLDKKEIQSSCWLDVERFRNGTLHNEVEMLPGQFFPAYSLDDYYLWGFTYRLLLRILTP